MATWPMRLNHPVVQLQNADVALGQFRRPVVEAAGRRVAGAHLPHGHGHGQGHDRHDRPPVGDRRAPAREQHQVIRGQTPGQDRDDRERDRHVREALHLAAELLGIAKLVEPFGVGLRNRRRPRCFDGHALTSPCETPGQAHAMSNRSADEALLLPKRRWLPVDVVEPGEHVSFDGDLLAGVEGGMVHLPSTSTRCATPRNQLWPDLGTWICTCCGRRRQASGPETRAGLRSATVRAPTRAIVRRTSASNSPSTWSTPRSPAAPSP